MQVFGEERPIQIGSWVRILQSSSHNFLKKLRNIFCNFMERLQFTPKFSPMTVPCPVHSKGPVPWVACSWNDTRCNSPIQPLPKAGVSWVRAANQEIMEQREVEAWVRTILQPPPSTRKLPTGNGPPNHTLPTAPPYPMQSTRPTSHKRVVPEGDPKHWGEWNKIAPPMPTAWEEVFFPRRKPFEHQSVSWGN